MTAKSEDSDKILGLNIGADDYITKPFNPVEVSARVKSQLRRYTQLGSARVQPQQLAIAGIELDDQAKTVTLDGDPVTLTPTEFDILKLLMEHPDTVYSPKDIYKKVWKEEPIGNESMANLDNGTYDILADIVQTEERKADYLFTDEAIGSNNSMISVRAEDDRWDYGNVNQISQMSIGVLASYANNADFRSWCTSHGDH